jgi:hypothetical protein
MGHSVAKVDVSAIAWPMGRVDRFGVGMYDELDVKSACQL